MFLMFISFSESRQSPDLDPKDGFIFFFQINQWQRFKIRETDTVSGGNGHLKFVSTIISGRVA